MSEINEFRNAYQNQIAHELNQTNKIRESRIANLESKLKLAIETLKFYADKGAPKAIETLIKLGVRDK